MFKFNRYYNILSLYRSIRQYNTCLRKSSIISCMDHINSGSHKLGTTNTEYLLYQRLYGTAVNAEVGFFTKTIEKLGFTGKLAYGKSRLERSAITLYLCSVGMVNYEDIFTEFDLPDTFNSWFRITELHMWMLIVRLEREGREGKYVRNGVMRCLWKDLEERTKKMGNVGSKERREGIGEFADQFKASLFGYDEALLDDDRVLAGALWRHFFELKYCDDPEKLELLVHYVRRQISHLDSQDTHIILNNGLMTWLPLDPTQTLNKERTSKLLKHVLGRT